MKKILSILLSVLLPAILVQLYWAKWSDILATGAIVLLYLITIIGLVLFCKFRLSSPWILPFGFILPVVICYIDDTEMDAEWLTYLPTISTAMYYSIPFIIISVTLAVIFTICDYKHKGSCSRKQKGCKRFLSKKLTIHRLKEAVIKRKSQILLNTIALIVLLTIAIIYVGNISRKHEVRRDIIQTIDILTEQEEECIFKLSEVTKFKWDRVAYFEYPITELQISQALGVNYEGSTDVAAGFIFVYKGRVVREDVVSIAPGSGHKAQLMFAEGPLTILSEEDAVFKGEKMDTIHYSIKLVQ